ncbi:OadG family protein [Chloroherpeton thalassium]|nr:OadG family protein [Chloroherpeton thalassium]
MQILLVFDWSLITEDGIMISLVGYLVVFFSLILLSLVFGALPKVLNFNLKRKLKKKGEHEQAKKVDEEIPGEVNAAIGMSLFLYFNELHDTEQTILTMKKVSKRYSPWNSKIYNVINFRR